MVIWKRTEVPGTQSPHLTDLFWSRLPDDAGQVVLTNWLAAFRENYVEIDEH